MSFNPCTARFHRRTGPATEQPGAVGDTAARLDMQQAVSGYRAADIIQASRMQVDRGSGIGDGVHLAAVVANRGGGDVDAGSGADASGIRQACCGLFEAYGFLAGDDAGVSQLLAYREVQRGATTDRALACVL